VHLRAHVTGLMIAGGLPSKPLQLLSAPCASGEEPYSLAMTLLDMGLPAECFRIDAVDICRQSIRKARQAIYGKHSFRGVSEAEKAKHFQITSQGLALNPEIRNTVHFKCANLMTCLAESTSNYDVVFCRNLLIYLEETASQHLLASFASLMKPGALLILGAAETGKVPAAQFSSIRESFVFGFLRREEQTNAPAPSTEAAVTAISSRRERPPGSQARSLEPAARQPRRRPLRPSSPAAPPSARPIPAAQAGQNGPQAAGENGNDLERCRQELVKNPYCDATYLQLAQILEFRNQSEAALECLQKCLYLQPSSRPALEAMIQLTKKLGQVERSRQFQGRLARLVP
jgi:chemotaxis protein methyltransferase WspC